MKVVAEKDIKIILYIEYKRNLQLNLKQLIILLQLIINIGINEKNELIFIELLLKKHQLYFV